MQHNNRFWQIFLVLIGCIVLWYTSIAAYKIYQYYRLNAHAEASSVAWSVKNETDDSHFLVARYRFSPSQNASFEGSTVFTSPIFWNSWAAEQAIKDYSVKSWTVWFAQNDPAFSTLQKYFPVKEALSAIAVWGILLYFLWLDWYVAKFRS